MKNLKSHQLTCLILSLSLMFSFPAAAQVQTARYTKMSSKVNAFYEYLPQGYSPTGTITYPVIISLPASGGLGNGTPAELPKALNGQPAYWISRGYFPTSFTVKGQTFKFIVITPQFIYGTTPDHIKPIDIDTVINFVVKNYKVNLNRIYLTGTSYGGGLAWYYVAESSVYARRIAAVVSACGTAALDTSKRVITNKAKNIAANNVAVWATHNHGDTRIPDTFAVNNVNRVNVQSPAPYPPARYTLFHITPTNNHDAWTKTYESRSTLCYREGGYNVYEWMLLHQRGPLPPVPSTNVAPKANAGADLVIHTPASTATLKGTGTDADGTITYYSWRKVSGSPKAYLLYSGLAQTTVMGLVPGTYSYELTVYDNYRTIGKDIVQVIVNHSPKANAGADKVITLPTNYVNLSGSGSDADGTIASYLWTKISGPASFTFSSTTVANPKVSNLVAGTYTFRLTVKDNRGGTGYDNIVVIVNQPPKANAGADKTITLPTNYVNLSGSGSDADGTIASYLWTKISGPASFTFSSTTVANPKVSNLVAGTYTFRLTVKDNRGAMGYDNVLVTVNSSTSSITQSINSDGEQVEQSKSITIAPNPVFDRTLLRLSNGYTGMLQVQVISEEGSMVKRFRFAKDQQVLTQTLYLGDLAAGNYIISVRGGSWQGSRKITKL